MKAVACPKCQHGMEVPVAYLGKEVKCNGCGVPFVARVAPPPPSLPQAPAANIRKPVSPATGFKKRMAKACPACGKEISPKAESCPACGHPIKKQTSCITWIVLIGFLAVAMMTAIGLIGGGGRSNTPNPPDVTVSFTSHTLLVTNQGAHGWTDMTIYVNGLPTIGNNGYKWTGPAPAIGETKTVPLTSVAKDSGERFDPTRFRVTKIAVGGGGYDYATFTSR